MNKSVWKLILKVIMAVVTTIAGAVGITSCMG
ncbi:MAG: smalltalk protein [Bacteroidales bacterium]|nr:smalltalk protein [Bacteroidales bacterium]